MVKFCDTTLTTNSLALTLPKEEGIMVSPNPFTSEISITFQKQNIKQATVTIENIVGQTVYQAPLPASLRGGEESSARFDLSFLSKGIYLVEVFIDDEQMVRKIVKD
jgi:hypothetical protein